MGTGSEIVWINQFLISVNSVSVSEKEEKT